MLGGANPPIGRPASALHGSIVARHSGRRDHDEDEGPARWSGSSPQSCGGDIVSLGRRVRPAGACDVAGESRRRACDAGALRRVGRSGPRTRRPWRGWRRRTSRRWWISRRTGLPRRRRWPGVPWRRRPRLRRRWSASRLPRRRPGLSRRIRPAAGVPWRRLSLSSALCLPAVLPSPPSALLRLSQLLHAGLYVGLLLSLSPLSRRLDLLRAAPHLPLSALAGSSLASASPVASSPPPAPLALLLTVSEVRTRQGRTLNGVLLSFQGDEWGAAVRASP